MKTSSSSSSSSSSSCSSLLDFRIRSTAHGSTFLKDSLRAKFDLILWILFLKDFNCTEISQRLWFALSKRYFRETEFWIGTILPCFDGLILNRAYFMMLSSTHSFLAQLKQENMWLKPILRRSGVYLDQNISKIYLSQKIASVIKYRIPSLTHLNLITSQKSI